MHERIVRFTAGTLVLTSIMLAIIVNINWLFLTGFVGINLIQSSITRWCLLNDILRALKVPNTNSNYKRN